MTSDSPGDRVHFMRRALELAQRGNWTTTPNPRVGCVLVQSGRIVGEGWHERAGEPHAEVHALRGAGAQARGATAFVTLEPCSHRGRTPPCANALIEAGIARVVVAMEDPNPRVAGQGLARLRAAGIDVEVGVEARAAAELNPGFTLRMTEGRPWIRAKLALSLDGRSALGNGVSQWITGLEARTEGHRWRACSCAVATGGGTIRQDDPALTVRVVETTRQPQRLVLDPRLETPATAQVLKTGGQSWFYCIDPAPSERQRALEAAGGKVVPLPVSSMGRVDLRALVRAWGGLELNEVLLEAGPHLTGALLEAGLVDEVLIFQAPLLLGEGALGAVNWSRPLSSLAQGKVLEVEERRVLGRDWLIRARVRGSGTCLPE
ncbi:bifunctional diaminohydroxyphosphoribosylaminopyrimidine deaminase/5-amino-6-(5-phosphoribosylamino)uracil reductase RibD [Ferrovum myxofaciens]|uniref:bifunctional diaminohydroxyphosphoribosylaminopyrimidine deaminase/5-amino-6-(5-phosphoribosylamino)uracil reductase RibD n=1 Tax=Ferrovum myxofaciens TaxID=416213 RepID=UPI0023570EC5|nr:bifunctional diaminohydroxyphosphoribosylaminopyrimidine deaminase/5-amino-6-(5-phosphoribosylamino)uracil reductase RibD [Ferrovum myxofaciens]MBU6994504.1 bifunctional diaminohydroxyphosphoribosylaminopyrimidine deaminase/5-amino-6-(5-phosphoribosylamino)uracil reductase RibD [Ferrovum myxofaciens]